MTISDIPDPDNLPVDPAEIEQVDVKQVHDEQRGEAPALVDPDRTEDGEATPPS